MLFILLHGGMFTFMVVVVVVLVMVSVAVLDQGAHGPLGMPSGQGALF